jgi:branched-chain amino acid transport system substrate-binding protein
MAISQRSWPVDRRAILKSSAAIAAVQFSSPFIIKARGETPVRIGMVDPLTGVYAAIAQGEVVGAKFAAEEINKKGGILGRPVELLIEDSANDVGTGVQKTRKLIERDQVSFIVGDVNSGIAIAMAQVTSEKRCSTSSREGTPTPSPARTVRGTCSGFATPPPWTPTPSAPR